MTKKGAEWPLRSEHYKVQSVQLAAAQCSQTAKRTEQQKACGRQRDGGTGGHERFAPADTKIGHMYPHAQIAGRKPRFAILDCTTARCPSSLDGPGQQPAPIVSTATTSGAEGAPTEARLTTGANRLICGEQRKRGLTAPFVQTICGRCQTSLRRRRSAASPPSAPISRKPAAGTGTGATSMDNSA